MEQPQFSSREKTVIKLLAEGKSNKQIALTLGLSVRTIEFHLSKIFAKLGVASRTEAVIQLNEFRLRESTGMSLRESTMAEKNEVGENPNIAISTRRIPMKNTAYLIFGLAVATWIIWLFALNCNRSAGSLASSVSPATFTSLANTPVPTQTPPPTVSPKAQILEQIRQIATEYNQAVEAEKKNGNVALSKDTQTGEESFHFTGDSFGRILNLWIEAVNQVNRLIRLYDQVYRDEVNPTPFPTSSSSEQTKTYYELLLQQLQDCNSHVGDSDHNAVAMYDPNEGKYMPIHITDIIARCDVYGQMIEEWRTAPMLAKVNQQADMALIRQIMGQPDLKLTFESISELSNASARNAALYTDATGTKYFVDIETARLAEIDPNITGNLSIRSNEVKSMDELRGIARQFARTNSPRLAALEPFLLYEENCKSSGADTICFFRWDYRNRDWSGTDWAMMPPFLQVGVLSNGQIVSYNNSLDLF